MTLHEIAQATHGKVSNGDCVVTRVCTDSRQLQAGDLFVALRGARYDASEFIQHAVDKKAAGVVAEKLTANYPLPAIEVGDSTVAFGKIAQLNRAKFHGKLVAVTGSCGKTTVKTLLANILAEQGNVLATKGNLNNHIGVPMTLLELSPQHELAVIEMGANGPREIAYLTQLARPDVGLITNALRAHVEGFGSLEGVATAKGELYEGLAADATAVLNLDDAAAVVWKQKIGDRRTLTFSLANPSADFFASNVVELATGAMDFVLNSPAGQVSVRLQLLGRHNLANALAAAAAAFGAGANLEQIKAGLAKTAAVAGRMQTLTTSAGATLIDDSYNANPDSVRAAIDLLASRSETAILVLGDLAELGEQAAEMHAELGDYAKQRGILHLLTVGELTKQAMVSFGAGAKHFDSHAALIDHLKFLLNQNTVVLIKGSRVSRMDVVVAALTSKGEK